MERLHWLLDGSQDGHERVLFYSGHGAQIPAFGANDEVDHLDECLVPWDFDWSDRTAIIDKQFYQLYSQLPYGTQFLAIFDCCHSGGMTRDGSSKIRGLNPPDDIRHRILEWDAENETWKQRDLKTHRHVIGGDDTRQQKFVGANGVTFRLGRAIGLRKLSKRQFDHTVAQRGHKGPFVPVILEACREDQFSYEYRNGTTAYGAFTFSMIEALRKQPKSSFKSLINAATRKLADLKYTQNPQLVGPTKVVNRRILGGSVPCRRPNRK